MVIGQLGWGKIDLIRVLKRLVAMPCSVSFYLSGRPSAMLFVSFPIHGALETTNSVGLQLVSECGFSTLLFLDHLIIM